MKISIRLGLSLVLLSQLSGCDFVMHGSKDPMSFREYQQHVVEIDKAEQIQDPLQRCLSYPTPPEFDWPQEMVSAFCHDLHAPVARADYLRKLIDAENWDGLEQHFTGYLQRHHSGEDAEYLLYRAFPVTSWNTVEESQKYSQRWLMARPESAYANMLRGKLLLRDAKVARGGDYISNISAADISKFTRLAEKARVQLRKAMILQPRLTPAYYNLLEAQMLSSSYDEMSATYRAAVKNNPANYYVRAKMLEYLQPKWGGSTTAMRRLVDETSPVLQRNPRLAALGEQPIRASGERFHNKGWYGNALEKYRSALQFGPEDEGLTLAGDAATNMKHHAQAMMYYTQAMRFENFDNEAQYSRALAWWRLGDADRAYCDFKEIVKVFKDDTEASKRIAELEAGWKKQKAKIVPAKICVEKDYIAGLRNKVAAASKKSQ